MKNKNIISAVLNIFSVILILLATLVTIMIFATNNRYSEPVFGETMLLTVREDSKADADEGALAIIDLTSTEKSDYYAAYVGGGARITKDPMASIGTVKQYIPVIGGIIDFFRNPLGFFIVIILPLVALVISYILRVILIIRDEKVLREKNSLEIKDDEESPVENEDKSV